jgi:phosphoribosylformimino-5-aminoimidazole carboxamide ribotide isomerase
MRLYPAIDLKDGKCVRLLKGDMAAATIYNDDAAAQALQFQTMGFDYIHVVDLNGAVSGDSVNHQAVQNIVKAVNVPVQLGGGIRNADAVKRWLDAGLTRVILGTIALTYPALVKEVAAAYPGKIVVGIDARGGMVATEGWVDTSTTKAVDLARHFEDAGVAGIIYTDIARDGTLAGPNLEETAKLAESVKIPVILSGGIAKLADVQAVKASGNIEGIVIGRALYEKTLDPHAALKAAA